MEKQIVLREGITWKQYSNTGRIGFTGIIGYRPVANVSLNSNGRWVPKVNGYYADSYETADEAKAVASYSCYGAEPVGERAFVISYS